MKSRGPTLATCEGHDHTRTKRTSRVGMRQATAMADSQETFTEAHVNKDGSGFLQILRPGRVNVRLVFGPEQGRGLTVVKLQVIEGRVA